MNALHRVSTDSGGLLTIDAVRVEGLSEEKFEGPRGFGKDGSSSTEYFGPLMDYIYLKAVSILSQDWRKIKRYPNPSFSKNKR